MPSLVNLAHVCSHLQNASLARLGLTSIPYTRLHLSLALLLQKQGFLSQVKLAGPSPPASCFPPGLRDRAHGNVGGSSDGPDGHLSNEAALQRTMSPGTANETPLRSRDTATSKSVPKTKQELEQEGWDQIAADFLAPNHDRKPHHLAHIGYHPQAISILRNHQSLIRACFQEVTKSHPDLHPDHPPFQHQLAAALMRHGFDADTLRYFAAAEENTYLRARDSAGDNGLVGIETLGSRAGPTQPPSQQPPPTLEHPRARPAIDPDDLETEGVVTQANRASRRLWLGLKYWDGAPVLSKARMISKPSKRIWLNYKDLGQVVRGNRSGEVKAVSKVGEIVAVLTRNGGKDGGVMEARECAERKLDGMVLCRIW